MTKSSTIVKDQNPNQIPKMIVNYILYMFKV